MTDENQELLDAFRAHLDLDEPPEAVLDAWRAADKEQRDELVGRLLLEALLVDTLSRGDSERRSRRRLSPFLKLAAAAIVALALGAGLFLWRARPRYPEPRAAGDFSVRSDTGERVSREALLRGDRVTAGPRGAALSLGGYCELALDPGTVVVLRGDPRKEAIELEEGRLLSRIAPQEGQFSVLTPRGSLEVVGTEFETTVTYPAPKGGNAVKRSKKSALVTVVVVSGLIACHFGGEPGLLGGGMSMAFAGEGAAPPKGSTGKIEAGRPRQLPREHPAWNERGRIVGRVRHCPGCEIDALDATGKVVKSFAVKPGGGGYELQWLSPATYALRVTANGYETLVVKNLAVKARNDLRLDIEFTEGAESRKIEAGRPRQLPREHPAWNERGRIVGRTRDCPGCKVEALDAKGKVVKSFAVKPGGRSYELQWLSPGTYALRVTADGYEALVLEKLAVKARSDLQVDLEF